MAQGAINYIEYGIALHDAIAKYGNRAWCENGTWYADDAAAAQAIINNYDPLVDVKAKAVIAVEARMASIFAAPYIYNGAQYDFDAQGRANINAAASLAILSVADPVNNPWPSPWYFYGYSNEQVAMTAAQMKAFGWAAGHYGSAVIQYACALVNQINAAANSAAVAAIDIVNGWPAA